MDLILDKIDTSTSHIIGLYFSGEYCKYCKEFTPLLIKNYLNILANNMDIVFISSDKSKEQYDKYRATQPWQSIEYEEKDIRLKLRETFDIKTIPALLFFDVKQKLLIEPDGRTLIRDDADNTIKALGQMIIPEYDSEDSDF